MGSIYGYTTTHGKRYRVIYRRPDGVQAQKRGFSTKRDAETFLTTVESAKLRGEYIRPTDADVRIGELGKQWLIDRKADLKPSVFHSVESAWRIHVEPNWAKRKIGSIAPSEVQSWVSGLAASHSASSVLRIHGVLVGILDVALRDRRISENPARNLRLPKKQRSARTYLSHSQVQLLASTARYPTLIYVLAYTGLRWGEATGLRIRNIDFAKQRLNVQENAVLVNGRIHVGTTKTGRTRSVPFPQFLASDLSRSSLAGTPTNFSSVMGRTT